MQDKSFKIGVVPEHFSIPFHYAKEKGIFDKHGVKVEIEEFPRGTGSMCRALRTGELDIAVALTEGIISDIASAGPEIGIIGQYVDSSLHWGVWVHPDAALHSLSDLKGKTFGISRFGSGSHLMVSLLAKERHWETSDVKFEVKGGLSDLVGGIADKTTDAFMWEKFTTKHCADAGQVRLLGEIQTPWPCFIICARHDVIQDNSAQLKNLLKAVRESSAQFVQDPNNLQMISQVSKLSIDDSKKWLHEVSFSETNKVSTSMLEKTVSILVGTGKSRNNNVSYCTNTQ